MQDRPTFSPFWHRVRTMRPRLRPHVEITRQRYRGRRWHVVHDPTSNQFYRLNPVAHEFVGTLDGARDVETAWQIALQKFGDAAPTQNEVIQLISQLYSANLLAADTSPETEQLLSRGRDRVKKKVQQQAIGIMYFRIRLFNPDRLLTALEPVFRPLLNRWGLLLWAAFILYAVSGLLPRWSRLVGGFDTAISPANAGWMVAVYVVLKAIHETGHGLICKRFGGQVPEFGAMFLVLFPSPYVDASACWAFPSKYQRMAVGAGGMIFELFCAAAASFVWLSFPEESLPAKLAYNAMFTASVSTVLFNANPLMRFDGYYILSDLLETPNLAQRSNSMLKYLLQKHVYRLERVTPPTTLRGESAVLIIYGLAAMVYRLFLFVSITLLVMGKLFAIGLVLALWTAAAWFIIPVGGFIHWLAASATLADKRPRAILTSLALLGAAVLAVGVIPFPDHRRGTGVVESTARAGVFVLSDGFVARAHKRPGERVGAGEPILTLTSPELREQRVYLLSQIEEMQLEERRAMKEHEPAVAQIARDRAGVVRENLAETERKIDELTVRAPHAGVVVGPDPSRMLGAYVKRGDPVCEVVDPASLRVAASLNQAESSWLFDPALEGRYAVEMRLVSDVAGVIGGANVRPVPGSQALAHPAMGYAGGGDIETDPRDQQGRIAKRPRFTVYVDPLIDPDHPASWAGAPGERVRLRFTLPSKALALQWYDRLTKTLQGRAKV